MVSLQLPTHRRGGGGGPRDTEGDGDDGDLDLHHLHLEPAAPEDVESDLDDDEGSRALSDLLLAGCEVSIQIFTLVTK